MSGVPANPSNLRDAFRSFGTAEEIALCAGTSRGTDKAQLLVRLDTFGRRGNAQLTSQRDDAANHCGRLSAMHGFTHKLTVDLQRVE